MVDIARELGCCTDIIHDLAVANNIPIQNKGNTLLREQVGLAVKCYDKNGNFIQEFQTIADAARWCVYTGKAKTNNGGVRSHISGACLGKRQSAYGYKWIYADLD